MAEIIQKKTYRILTDAVEKTWAKIAFWTKSEQVEFNDGKSAEFKLGTINGITDSLESTSSNIAASAKAVSDLNSNLQSSFQAGVDSVYNAVKAKGTTPASKSLSDVVIAINNIETDVKHTISLSIKCYKEGDYTRSSGSLSIDGKVVKSIWLGGSGDSVSYDATI